MSSSSLTTSAYLFEPIAVVQPPELETDDPSLATVVLPAPPPLNSQRRDYRRPQNIFSYLPASDPGTTYSGLMGGLGLTLIPPEDEGGRLRKRQRTDRNFVSRSIHSSHPSVVQPQPQPASSTAKLQSDSLQDFPFQRMNSAGALSDHSNTSIPPDNVTNSSKVKNKGKEKEKPFLRVVKDEPQSAPLDSMDVSNGNHYNEDHCSSCRDIGNLLYCDGCPRSFHLWCLDPPMDNHDVPEGDARWFCPACLMRQNPPPKPRRSLLAPLLQQLQMSIPTEFELPEEIRNFFKDGTSRPAQKGLIKIPLISKPSVPEEREAYRLKDRNGSAILCFRCGKSALPESESGSSSNVNNVNEDTSSIRGLRSGKFSNLRNPDGGTLWKSIVSCDYCSLHWHLDCLDPPLASMPAAHKKWMCPAHVQHVAPKRRIPRHLPPVTDIVSKNCPNNGNIEIIPADNRADLSKKMNVDEVHINGRRYRVPERVVILDFWDKLRSANRPSFVYSLLQALIALRLVSNTSHHIFRKAPAGIFSGVSSPLTSLSSLEDEPPSPRLSLTGDAPEGSVLKNHTTSNLDLLHAANVGQSTKLTLVSCFNAPFQLLLACQTPIHRINNNCMEVDRCIKIPSSSRINVAVQTESMEETVRSERQAVPAPAPRPVPVPVQEKVEKRSSLIDIAKNFFENQISPNLPVRSHRRRLPKRPGVLKPPNVVPSDSVRITRSKTAPSVNIPKAEFEPTSTSIHLGKATPVKPPADAAAEILPSNNHTQRKMSTPSSGTRKITRSMGTGKLPDRESEREYKEESPEQFKANPTPPLTSTKPSQQVNPPSVLPPSSKSPFKIRIPKAINTAVAAATAAAAAAAAVSSSSNSSNPPNGPHGNSSSSETPRKMTSDSDSSLSPVSSDSLGQNSSFSKVNGIDTEVPNSSPSLTL
ncbi:hypothetical protein Clacol_006689 [Clathrus columnatus]|uniref:PHD-type domain-containing protein n=1 Tax=Clathrus columnatus TaxID=1419009 RepID=A0AAV5AFL5_9AGAM|nr:hypothetical protein Clacol_006689 [Clathrus columnatus]